MRELDYYAKLLERGTISRRVFMGRALALGATFAMATSMASTAAKAAPKKGGRLRLGITGGRTGDTLDPAQILDTYMTMVRFENLSRATPTITHRFTTIT